MEQLQKLNSVAENLAVAFKLASSSATLMTDDMDMVREAQKIADPSYFPPVEIKWSFSGFKKWLLYKKAVYDLDIVNLKKSIYIKNKINNGK